MVIFAWILWGLYILMYSLGLAFTVAGFIAFCNGKSVKIKFNVLGFLINAAVFVFLNLYLFA